VVLSSGQIGYNAIKFFFGGGRYMEGKTLRVCVYFDKYGSKGKLVTLLLYVIYDNTETSRDMNCCRYHFIQLLW
jgi:hypothetical protein